MSEEIDEDRVKRIEEITARAYKLAKLVRRRHNQVTKAFNKNFEVFDEEIKRNTANIDKIVNTLRELMGEKSEGKKKVKEKNYVKSLYL